MDPGEDREGEWGPVGRTFGGLRGDTPAALNKRGGWGGGKMLKRLFRGWWAKGVCGGGREEGCREEGGLWGCIASHDHVIYEGLG